MAILEYYGTAEGYIRFWCIMDCDDLEDESRQTILDGLEMASGDLNVAIASVGADSCTYTASTLRYLERIAYVSAAVFYNCPCNSARLSDESKAMYMEWISTQLGLIRDGDIELCQGETSRSTPSIGWAEQVTTPWTEDQIIANAEARDG